MDVFFSALAQVLAPQTFGIMLIGIAIGLVNYISDFPVLLDEILPRLERLGLRLGADRQVETDRHEA